VVVQKNHGRVKEKKKKKLVGGEKVFRKKKFAAGRRKVLAREGNPDSKGVKRKGFKNQFGRLQRHSGGKKKGRRGGYGKQPLTQRRNTSKTECREDSPVQRGGGAVATREDTNRGKKNCETKRHVSSKEKEGFQEHN